MTLIHLFIHYFFDDCELCLFTLFKSRANVTFARFSHTHTYVLANRRILYLYMPNYRNP